MPLGKRPRPPSARDLVPHVERMALALGLLFRDQRLALREKAILRRAMDVAPAACSAAAVAPPCRATTPRRKASRYSFCSSVKPADLHRSSARPSVGRVQRGERRRRRLGVGPVGRHACTTHHVPVLIALILRHRDTSSEAPRCYCPSRSPTRAAGSTPPTPPGDRRPGSPPRS